MQNIENINTSNKQYWKFPWKFRESFIFSFWLLLVGFLLESITEGKGIVLPSWPFNFIIIISFITLIVFTYYLIKHPAIRWLSSIPAAISAISVFTFLILLMGFIPQQEHKTISFLN